MGSGASESATVKVKSIYTLRKPQLDRPIARMILRNTCQQMITQSTVCKSQIKCLEELKIQLAKSIKFCVVIID